MAKKKIEYNDQAISMLKGADRVRKRPAVIFGSDGIDGCQHSFFEILSNSIDEYREGYGDRINVTVFRDRTMEVEDFGRGVPLDWNEKEQRYNWELIYCEMYAGGKFENNSGGAYEYALGLNGLGACATQYASEFMDIVSYQRGTKYTIGFKKGELDRPLEKNDCPKSKTGTVVRWRSDREVFTDTAIPKEYFLEVMKRQSVVNAGLTLSLKFENHDGTFENFEFCYEKGIVDYINEIVGDKVISPVVDYSGERVGRDSIDRPEYKLKMQFAFCFSNDVNMIEYYHNSSYLKNGGSPDKATRSAFVWAIDQYIRTTGKYNKNESKITFNDVQDSLVLVVNSLSSQASFSDQTKLAVTNSFIADAMTEFFKHCLQVYFVENPQLADKICAQILVNKRARESAEHMRVSAKKKLSVTLDINNTVEKFVGCRIKDPSRSELYIVEGDSALASCKLARNAEFQAIIPVRGKTLNCLKASVDRIMNSDIILDLIKVIGCGVELKLPKGKNLATFDLNNLRWDKVIICTDADEDGYQIRTLILTMFYRLLPTLIEEGRIYIAESPLYEITCGSETFFAYNEQEKNAIVSKLGDKKVTLQRSKGLGENDPDMMSHTTMNPATRKLLRISPDDAARTAEMFDILLGDNIAGRKEFIAQHGAKYLELADY